MYYLYYGNSFKEGGAVGLIGFPVGGNIDEIQCVKMSMKFNDQKYPPN